jgi:DNA helicase-2/ATP-dependent DNA helicase PcrA
VARRRDDLCVVGDPAQTIYTFAGATPSHLLGFRARYPHATEVRLVRSYRCSPQIVSLANAVLASAVAPASAARLVLRSEQPDGEAPQVLDYRDEKEEAEGVAARIAALVASGTAPRDIAVLYRVNAASEAYEEALGERGIAVDLRGAERFFDRPEVRQAITLLRGAARAGAGPDHDEAAPGPAAGADLVGQVHDVLAGMGWTADPATAGTGATGEKWANLGRLATLAADLAAARPEAGLDDLVADLSTRAEHAHVPAAEAVTLASLHAAKGLEWPVVFLVGLTDGMLPISYADTPERVEEERRLFYVGVTRAARMLTLSWAQARTPGGRRRSRSRFLDDVAGQAGVPASQPRVVRGSGGRGERKRRGRPRAGSAARRW